MKKTIFLITMSLTLALMGASTSIAGGEIYKWTDSDGKVHYGERPKGKNAEQMSVTTKAPYGSPSAQKTSSSSDAANKFLETMATERKEKKEAADKAAKEKKVADKNCSNARKRVASLQSGGRKYEFTEQGERKYLDDAEVQRRLKEAQKKVEEWCK